MIERSLVRHLGDQTPVCGIRLLRNGPRMSSLAKMCSMAPFTMDFIAAAVGYIAARNQGPLHSSAFYLRVPVPQYRNFKGFLLRRPTKLARTSASVRSQRRWLFAHRPASPGACHQNNLSLNLNVLLPANVETELAPALAKQAGNARLALYQIPSATAHSAGWCLATARTRPPLPSVWSAAQYVIALSSNGPAVPYLAWGAVYRGKAAATNNRLHAVRP